jgi:5-methylcytosine-specific restriction endonuclease McrA
VKHSEALCQWQIVRGARDVSDFSPVVRKCKTCNTEKLLDPGFRSHFCKKNGRTYRGYECIECERLRSLKYQHDNRELVRAKGRANYAAELEKHRARGRSDYLKHRDRARARKVARRAENVEHVRAQDREIAKRWRAAHPFESREWPRRQRAMKRAAQTEEISKHQIKDLYEKQCGRCAICRKKLKKYHIDHIKPLSRGGAHEIKNFQLLCPTCNLTKRATDPITHMQKLGFLL